MPESPSFVFFSCQVGAEPALKHELAREWQGLRFAYSRPGFLTFKLDSKLQLPDHFADRLVFARAAGFCLGKTTGTTTAKRAESVWKLVGERPVTQVHVWPRDRHSPGFRDYEPGMTPEIVEIERVIRECRLASTRERQERLCFSQECSNCRAAGRRRRDRRRQ